jgi:uncharacterized membrane protein YsdA (DUF1294 family)
MGRILWRVYLILSLITLLLFGIDKFLAKAEWKRIPERWLYTMTLIGGFPGAIVGMNLFHHKIRNKKFRWVIIGSILLHAAGIAVLFARLRWF